MSTTSAWKIVLLLAISSSFATVVNRGAFPLPTVPLARANSESPEPWYPAGPAMNTALVTMFSDSPTEFRNFGSSSPSIDFTDSPLTPALLSEYAQDPRYLVTQAQPEGFSELEFNLANNFWGCPFDYGNSQCGIDIRQGIAHLVDKTIFALREPDLNGGVAIDNPLSAGSTLPTPNACGWDATFVETGSDCIIGGTKPGDPTYTGGTAYHLAPATGACIPSLSGCTTVAWMQNNPSPDFCAGAEDIMNGMMLVIPPGIGSGNGITLMDEPGGGFPSTPESSWTFNSSTNCQLLLYGNTLGISNLFNANPITFYIPTDNPALQSLGDSYAEEICGLWSGSSYSIGCSSVPVPREPVNPMNVLDTYSESSAAFPGYLTSTGSNPTTDWGMFIAGPGSFVPENPFEGSANINRIGELASAYCEAIGCDPYDLNLYFSFNSKFVSGIPSIQCTSGNGSSCSPGPCSPASAPSSSAPDYMYLCSPAYDTISSQMEFAPCLSAVTGNDVNTQVGQASPTFRDCNGNVVPPSTQPLTSIGAGLQAEDAFGKGAFAIPVFTSQVQYAYLNNGWNRAISSGGTFNYFTLLNAWNQAPAQPGTLRQGLSQNVNSLNPYIASSTGALSIVGDIYDSLMVADPYDQGGFINWMNVYANQLPNSALSYSPPPGTVSTFRFTLRSDMFFQDGTKVTSFDVAFSYLSLLGTGSILGSPLAPMTGITILGPTQFDIGVNAWGTLHTCEHH